MAGDLVVKSPSCKGKG